MLGIEHSAYALFVLQNVYSCSIACFYLKMKISSVKNVNS